MIRKQRLSSPRTRKVVHDHNVIGNSNIFRYTSVMNASECNEEKNAAVEEAKGYSENIYEVVEENALIAQEL